MGRCSSAIARFGGLCCRTIGAGRESAVGEAKGSSAVGKGLRAALSVLPPSTASYLQQRLFPIPVLGRGLRVIAGSAAAGEGMIKNGPARGLRIDATGTLFSFVLGTCDPDEQRLLVKHLHPGGVYYDLGANIGFFSLLAARLVGPTGHVVAFEPSPVNAAQLQRNIDLNGFTNITLVEAAVSSKTGFAQLDTATKERGQARLAEATKLPVTASSPCGPSPLTAGAARRASLSRSS
jgi:hypothetical protein